MNKSLIQQSINAVIQVLFPNQKLNNLLTNNNSLKHSTKQNSFIQEIGPHKSDIQKFTSQNTHFKIKFFTLGVLLTQDKTVQSYNKQYRNKDKPTNVLSFQGYDDITELYDKSETKISSKNESGNALKNTSEDTLGDDSEYNLEYVSKNELNHFEQEPPHLGDLIFGYETIQKELENLKEEDTCFNSYFCNLCVHGLLHLFDIHHDTLEDECKMNQIAKKCANILGIEFIL